MKHQHKYDANGKQICCTLEEKMNNKIEKQSGCCSTHNDHDHPGTDKTMLQMFLPAIISFTLLLIAIVNECQFPGRWHGCPIAGRAAGTCFSQGKLARVVVALGCLSDVSQVCVFEVLGIIFGDLLSVVAPL